MRQPRRVSRHLARQRFRHPPYRALSVFPDTTGIAPSPARHVAPRLGSRHAGALARQARGPSRALAALLAVGGTPPPRALPRMWRTVPCDASSTAYAAALQHGTRAALIAALTRRALRPGHVACGDRCVRRTIPPHHHAGTKDLVSTTLGATGPKADFGPRHYRNPASGDMARKTMSTASGRPSGSDGALRRGSPLGRAGRGSPRAVFGPRPPRRASTGTVSVGHPMAAVAWCFPIPH